MSTTEYHRLWRERNREKIRKYNRKYNAKWRKTHGYSTEKRYAIEHPKKRRAQNKVKYFLKRRGHLRKPCVVCGATAQAHHPNYNKIWEVIFLCDLHHKRLHADTLKLAQPSHYYVTDLTNGYAVV